MILGVVPEPQQKLIDGNGVAHFGDPEPATACYPLRYAAVIGGVALGLSVLAQEHIAATAKPISQCDNGLFGLFVYTIGRSFLNPRHGATNPSAESFGKSFGVRPHFRTPRGKVCVDGRTREVVAWRRR